MPFALCRAWTLNGHCQSGRNVKSQVVVSSRRVVVLGRPTEIIKIHLFLALQVLAPLDRSVQSRPGRLVPYRNVIPLFQFGPVQVVDLGWGRGGSSVRR